METLHVALPLTALLCSLVAGLVFAFACVAMPGIGTLNDREFLHAFQAMDRVIQNNQPAFMVVWVGSGLAIVVTGFLGLWQLAGIDRVLVLVAAALYIAGVQVPTAAINIPLNNQLQTLDLQTLDEAALAEARRDFEPRWNRWNNVRTVLAIVTSVLLLILILRL